MTAGRSSLAVFVYVARGPGVAISLKPRSFCPAAIDQKCKRMMNNGAQFRRCVASTESFGYTLFVDGRVAERRATLTRQQVIGIVC